MKPVRIYISVIEMINTKSSLLHIINSIQNSNLKYEKIIIVHSLNWGKYDFLTNSNLDIEYFDTGLDATSYEYPALQKLWKDSSTLDFYGLYLHCKGASRPNGSEYHNSLNWSTLMMYGVVDHSDLCRYHLDCGSDFVGSLFHWHFKGNFFWFKSEYVKQLIDPMKLSPTYRFHAEFWGLYSYWWGRYPLPKIKNLFYLPIDHDNDFIKIKKCPSLFQKHILTEPFSDHLSKYKYEIYDVILVNDSEYNTYNYLFKKYLNYDGVIINMDTRQIIQYDDI